MENLLLITIGDFLSGLNFEYWKEILMLLIAGGFLGIITAVKKAIKEIKDVKEKYIKYKVDGFTPEETKDLIEELGEAILAIDSVWRLLKNLFKKKSK